MRASVTLRASEAYGASLVFDRPRQMKSPACGSLQTPGGLELLGLTAHGKALSVSPCTGPNRQSKLSLPILRLLGL